jgi:4-amino-4-deoxy-L-arabinose transferase-like glycosyltransferase
MKKRTIKKTPSVSLKQESPKVGLGVAGFTLGIIGFLSLGLMGILLSFIGFIFCFIQLRTKKTKLGVAGIIINSLVFLLSWLWIFVIYPILAQRVFT